MDLCGDEAAPWPLGGAYSSAAMAALARLRALGALARLAGHVEGVAPTQPTGGFLMGNWLNWLKKSEDVDGLTMVKACLTFKAVNCPKISWSTTGFMV